MNEIFKKFKEVKMTAEEKQSGFNRLQNFINNNPAPSPWYKNISNSIISPFQDGLLLHHKMLATAFVVVLLISATGGTSIAAKYAIPGDTLYPIKINLNEKVETFTALGPEAKATIEAQHVDERLSEAEQLSAQNRLSNGIKAQLESQFSQNLQNTMTHINTLDTSGDSKNAKKVKVNIENSLQKHKGIVEEILNRKSSRSNKIAPKAMMIQPPTSTNNETKISTFSVTSVSSSTSTTSDQTENTQFQAKMETDVKFEDDFDDLKTPLLDETLKRILESSKDLDD